MKAYDRISRYKTPLMGIAILIVVYQHLIYYHSGLTPYQDLGVIQWYTVGAVDMFLFLSGFGIYRSLRHDADPLRFMQRRLGRLLPSYLPFILIYCAIMLYYDQMNKWQALGNLSTFGWWTRMGAQFNWYIAALMGMYLLSPLFYAIIERYGRRSICILPLFFLIDAAGVDSSLMIGLSRFPVYFLGMYLGREAALGHQPSRRHLTAAGILMVLGMIGLFLIASYRPDTLSKYGMWWHPYLLSTPGCLYLTTWVLQRLETATPGRLLIQFLTFLGRDSLEIYLWHLLIFPLGLYFGVTGWSHWCLLALLGILVGIGYAGLLHRITEWRKS